MYFKKVYHSPPLSPFTERGVIIGIIGIVLFLTPTLRLLATKTNLRNPGLGHSGGGGLPRIG
jgi:hypothetical protein